MTFLDSILNQSKKSNFPFDHWEYNNPLTNEAIEEIIKGIVVTVAEVVSIKPEQKLEMSEMEYLLAQWEFLESPLKSIRDNSFLLELSLQEIEKKLRT